MVQLVRPAALFFFFGLFRITMSRTIQSHGSSGKFACQNTNVHGVRGGQSLVKPPKEITKIRPLTLADRAAILELAKHTYGGDDYIYDTFQNWVSCPKHYFIGEEGKNKSIVACCNMALVDKGTTAWLEGLRVHPNYRGLGIASRLQGYLVNFAEKMKKGKGGGIERIRMTTTLNNDASRHLATKFGLKTVRTWSYVNMGRGEVKDCLQRLNVYIKHHQKHQHSIISRNHKFEDLMGKEDVLLHDWKVAQVCENDAESDPDSDQELNLSFAHRKTNHSKTELLAYSGSKIRPIMTTLNELKGKNNYIATIQAKARTSENETESAILELLKIELGSCLNDVSCQAMLLNMDTDTTLLLKNINIVNIPDDNLTLLYEKVL